MSRILTAIFQPLKCIGQTLAASHINPTTNLVRPENSLLTLVRTKVRVYFPRPNEVRRVRRHGWATRMSTPNGRRVIMRRFLKGRYVLSH